MKLLMRAALAALMVSISAGVALADDWVAVRLRGSVLQLVDGEWQKLSRGAVVPDSRVIRTLQNGNVEFARGDESVTIAANTQIQIFDEVRARPFTTVKQYFGTVTVEADVRDVQHFAVQTPYLAAVVKGTKFVVVSGDEGASVEVKRGHVMVDEKGSSNTVTIDAGESAVVSKDTKGIDVANGPPGAKPVNSPFAFLVKPRPDNDADEDERKPGKSGQPGKDDEGKPGKGPKDDKPGKGPKDDDHDKPGKGPKNDDDKPGKGPKGDDKSGKGHGDDKPGKSGKSHDDGDDKSGKGKGKGKHD